MSGTLAEFNELTDAEQYFDFFSLPYDPQLVNVNRLHILQKFSNAMKAINREQPELGEVERLTRYRELLQEAYAVFQSSTSVEQKLFKVFNDPQPNVVKLSDIGTEA
jgi:nitrogenase-stabilizing/protective protein